MKTDISLIESVQLPPFLEAVTGDIQSRGGKAYLVGGWVRDTVQGILSKDYDVEVYGLAQGELRAVLEKYGRPNLVGKAFGVMTMVVDGDVFDFAFPRTESKTGKGHKGFMVKPDPGLTFSRASARRDFTINAMGLKLPEKKISDPHGGLRDLQQGLLRHVSQAFGEDPLRAMRAVQFAGRFAFDIHRDTQEICRMQPLDELPPERLFEEFKKLLLRAPRPSVGLEWMRQMELLRFFPELGALIGVLQDPDWHPEGDLWTHNNLVMDAAARIRDEEISDNEPDTEFEKLSLMFGALCHDFGKPATTILKNGRWRSPAHSGRGERPTRSFMARLTRDKKLTERVVLYVKEHLKPAQLYKVRHQVKPATIRKLSLRFDIEKLVRLAKADHFGRTTRDALERRFEAGDWLIEQSKLLKVLNTGPVPLLTGKMLLELGMQPGPAMGKLIRKSFEIQLEGKLNDKEEVRTWARNQLHPSV